MRSAFSRIALTGLALALAGTLTAPTFASPPEGAKPIIPTARDAGFTTLLAAVKAAGLQSALASGEYTVLAPTNEAFAAVPNLDAILADKELLTRILTYHLIEGKVPASTVVTLNEAQTVQGSTVQISVSGDTVFLNGDTEVLATDVMARNGIIHVINKVLLPPQ